MRTLAMLTRDDIRNFEVAHNKVLCARQALRPNAVPAYAPLQARDKFFREAIFASADAEYLEDSFWRELSRQHGIASADMGRLRVDFNTNELLVNE
ncbi:MAG: hypothetical protein LBJ25_03885 [Candidatus Margulisbacteria bacterium]|jgi:hypothetical protein|nr:hypothetical protein [Candidatus Margulisiibacteriota bacterium]